MTELPLSSNLLVLLLSKLDLSSLTQMCQSSPQVVKICNSEEFWRFKHFQEFSTGIPSNENPKKYYALQKFQAISAEIEELKERIKADIATAFMNAVSEDEQDDMDFFVDKMLDQDMFDNTENLPDFIESKKELLLNHLEYYGIIDLNGVSIDAPEFMNEVIKLLTIMHNGLRQYQDLTEPLGKEQIISLYLWGRG